MLAIEFGLDCLTGEGNRHYVVHQCLRLVKETTGIGQESPARRLHQGPCVPSQGGVVQVHVRHVVIVAGALLALCPMPVEKALVELARLRL